MSDFFAYDELTWPEVTELPRDVPLIIPLGSGYDASAPLSTGLSLLAASLGIPPASDSCRPSRLAGAAADWLSLRRSSDSMWPICSIACVTMASRQCIILRHKESIRNLLLRSQISNLEYHFLIHASFRSQYFYHLILNTEKSS